MTAELQTQWARLLLGSLRGAGLRQVVISPGSRSTPFAWAALRDPGLECRSIIDERSAAFFALGHARITGAPVLVLCTSGTAAANYFPAVVEAAEAGVPLLVLTADRPLELQRADAPQTIDQVKLYGEHARAFFELGPPDTDPRMLRALPRLAAQALFTSLHPLPGPVHLNARARKPLEPSPGVVDMASGDDEAPAAQGPATEPAGAAAPDVEALIRAVRPTAPPRVSPDPDALEALARRLAETTRGIIVCGPALAGDAADPSAIAALGRATGFPVVAEPASQLRFGEGPRPAYELDAYSSILEARAFADAHRPEMVLQVGRPPTASAWHSALDRWPVDHRVLASHGWPAWTGDARVVHGGLGATVPALVEALERADRTVASRDAAWRVRLREANALAWRLTDASLEDGFPEGAAVRTVVDRLPRGSVLALGNSLSIREVERFVPAGDRGLEVWSQRGANGIDGLISGAAGAAAAGRPTTLLLGDVAFLHDVGGLAAARQTTGSLTVVVLNNGGGRIFERLPLADRLRDDPALATWLTPPGLDIEAACRAFGVPYHRAADRTSLAAKLDGVPGTGASVIEVVVPDGGTTEHQRRLRTRLNQELNG